MNNNQTLSFQVNLLNELLKIRSGYFTGTTTVLDELIQNAQRADASEINIYFESLGKIIRVRDNGRGCTDFNALITKSQSGWSNEIIKSQNAAGEGFLSTGLIANQVRFNSYVKVHFDFKKLFEEKTIECIHLIESYNGETPGIIDFGSEVIMTDFVVDFGQIFNDWKVYAINYLKVAPITINLYFDGILQVNTGRREQDFIEIAKTTNQHNFVIDNIDFMFISHIDSYTCDLYYQGRYVCQISSTLGIGGILIIKNSEILNIKLPDRKDYVRDSKLDAFKSVFCEAVVNEIREIHYEVWTHPMVDFISCCASSMIKAKFTGIAIGYYHNDHRDVFFEEVKSHITYVDRLASDNQQYSEIVANNIYHNFNVYDINKAFREILQWKFNVKLEPARFNGSSEVYNLNKDYTTKAFKSLFTEFFESITRRVYRQSIPVPEIVIGSFKNPDNAFVEWRGLYVSAKNEIYINVKDYHENVNLTTKSYCKHFLAYYMSIIVHEMAHAIYGANDGEANHYAGQLEIWQALWMTDWASMKPDMDWACNPVPYKPQPVKEAKSIKSSMI